MIHLRCQCGKQLAVPEVYIDRVGPCPACQRDVRPVASGFVPGMDDFAFVLVVEEGPERIGEQIFLGGGNAIEIGKRDTNTISLNDASISRKHCHLVRTDSGWRIEDDGSKNGVRVNGDRTIARDLIDGDMIRIGGFTLRYTDTSTIEPTDAPAKREETAEFDEGLYALAEMEEKLPAALDAPPPTFAPALIGTATFTPPTAQSEATGPTCPCCEKRLGEGAKICVECGIDLKTGRAVLTAYDGHLDNIYQVTEQVLRVVSWIIWWGIYPVASEALGTRKPHVIRAIAVITVLTTGWFWAYEWTLSSRMQSYKNLLLWCGQADPTPEQLKYYYTQTSYGDAAAFDAKLTEVEAAAARAKKNEKKTTNTKAPTDVASLIAAARKARADEGTLMLAAYKSLSPEQQCLGRYQSSQLITHAFLHAGIMHLVGNLIFLLVLGSRVNALVGNVVSLLLYPALAVAAGLAQMSSGAAMLPHPTLGASGAIMGLAGMYLVLSPVHDVHMVGWWRWGIIRRFELSLKFFTMRGIWVVLFYIAFDVVATVLGSKDGVAHWAHLGGFLTGVGIGFLLLFSRMVNCRGGDIISAVLGRRAWALVGKPNRTQKFALP